MTSQLHPKCRFPRHMLSEKGKYLKLNLQYVSLSGKNIHSRIAPFRHILHVIQMENHRKISIREWIFFPERLTYYINMIYDGPDNVLISYPFFFLSSPQLVLFLELELLRRRRKFI